ncbi:MAG: prepilin-type N-terminal cleavage/methylation domain-containing protein [Planctomycetota bacterium]
MSRSASRAVNGQRRGFSLIEAVAVVVVVAIAVPPALHALGGTTDARINALTTDRASCLAVAVLERITADIYAGEDAGLGYAALADAESYLNDEIDGLFARMGWLMEPYHDAGLTVSVDIGEAQSEDGTVSGDPAQDVFRTLTVRVGFEAANGSREIGIATRVVEL